ncbi:MAG: MFS transporter [Sphingomonadales bacterium]|nr:MFS transporter [Sphingomonadales bacterium]PIX66428.1 MAG: MFS transporter [Sphingomonadales bacterium CG_4_10_14_3_um_filter_58_15]NCO49999.1 MFS transporter [Sphingomonadales bacterium]NCP00462.1 MFS transporter [Sphingomonadales bacterium]NCP26700.1 MFS transporter [Sphingomonadales bacterium]
MASRSTTDKAFQAIVIDDEGRICADIPESACQQEPGNFFKHVGALALTKSADGLIDPKLVLSWLMTSLGAPVALIGLLVPVREAGALLPQLLTAGYLRRLQRRKWVWAVGSTIQGLAAAVIGLIAISLTGAAAGWAIVLALAILALARSVCSVCYKDVLGKTIDQSRRGTATGLAGSIASVTVIVYALALSFQLVDRMTLVIGGLFLAGGAWMVSAMLFATLKERAGATAGGKNALKEALHNFTYLRDDPQLVRFILTRGLLTATALAPPFMIAVGSEAGEGYDKLGFLVLASALAGLLSSFVWGRLSDRSSRKVLVFSALLAAIILGTTSWLAFADRLAGGYILPVLLFGLMIAYQGVRLGRSTHLVDMADEDTRAAYTALSNTVIGLLLLAGGVFSLVANWFGGEVVLAIMAGMSGLAILAAWGLDEVQRE